MRKARRARWPRPLLLSLLIGAGLAAAQITGTNLSIDGGWTAE